MTLTDAGPLVALIDDQQVQNQRCVAALAEIRLPMLTTWAAFAEAMYLLGRIGAWPMQDNLWNLVADGTLTFHAPSPDEPARMQALMERYRDRPMDLADASLVAAAEARRVSEIFTIDSDFYIYRMQDGQSFDVLPGY